MNNEIKYIVLQKGKKAPVVNQNNKQRIFVGNIDAIEDAGISLLNTKDIVVVDFDNLEENKGIENRIIQEVVKRYGCSLVVKTDKGYHLYFKSSKQIVSNWTKQDTICGVRTDAKVSGDNYVIIKRYGKMREHIGEISLNNLTELPDVLLPLYTKLNYDICNITEGERNNTLFKHLCQVRKRYDETNETDSIDLEEIARFINEVVFAEPLPDNEVQSIVKSVRKQEIEKINIGEQLLKGLNKDEKNDEFNVKQEALNLVNEYDIYYHNHQIFFKEKDMYVCNDDKLIEIAYSKKSFNINLTDNLLFHIKMKAHKTNNDNVIKLKNGALIDNKYVPEYNAFSPYQLNVKYDENAYSKELEDFLNTVSCNKKDIRQVIEEMVGHCLMLETFPHKFFYLFGSGSNGKSTFIEFLFDFFGNMAVSVPLNMLSKENYVIRLNNKLCNISDDIDMTYITSSQNLKGLCSGSYITGRELYEKAYTFKNNSTQIFVSNSLFSSKDKTYGFNRRIEIIPFDAEIREENKDPLMLQKLTTDEAKSYMLLLALKGIERIINNGYELSKSDYISNLVHRYIMESDSVEAFLEFGMPSIEDRKYSYVYTSYEKYCLDNNFVPCKKNGFSRRLTSKGYNTFTKKIQTEDGITKSVRYIKKVNKNE